MFLLFLYSFKGNATRISRLLRDNPRTFVQQAADWIEYVHRHKGAKHLRPEGYNLYWYQHYLLDVLAFLLTLIFSFFFAMRMLFRLVYKIAAKLRLLPRWCMTHSSYVRLLPSEDTETGLPTKAFRPFRDETAMAIRMHCLPAILHSNLMYPGKLFLTSCLKFCSFCRR